MHDQRNALDWALFAALSLLWAMAYPFTRLAVSQSDPDLGFPPQFIIPMRLTAGAAILLIIAFASGQKWPARSDWKSWVTMAVMGLLGTAAKAMTKRIAAPAVRRIGIMNCGGNPISGSDCETARRVNG